MLLQHNETLAHIAALVRENPSITVREIANKMSFADNKSVYYWLNKGNFSGIGDFKKSVLGADSDSIQGIAVEMQLTNYFLLKIPFRNWQGIKKEEGANWFYFLHTNPNPRGIFAIQVQTTHFAPWFLPNDIIIVNTSQDCQIGKWVLLKQGREYLIGRVGANNQILDPNTLLPLNKMNNKILGVIIHQQRNLS